MFSPLATYTNSAEDTESLRASIYSLQRAAARWRDYVFEVGYSGSRAYKGIEQILVNPAILSADQAALVRATGNANAIPGVQARRLYPQYGNRP